jgi:photoactive yellow protein
MGESPLDLAFAVLEEMPVGVIVISDDGRVAHYNRYEEVLAERKRENVLGKLFFDEVAPCLKAKQLKEPILEGIRTGVLNLEEEVSFDYRFLEVPREVILRARVFASGGKNFALLLLEDIGERRALERLRTTLGALLARDMKSPLRAAIGRLSEVEQELRDPPELAEHLFEAKRALKRVERMVEGLFEIARLETGTFPMNRKMTDVGEVLGDAVQEHARLADARRVRLVCETDEEAFPLLSLDGDLVRRAVGHLIANGVAHAKSMVLVRARDDQGELRIEVEDDGEGFSDARAESPFERSGNALAPGQEFGVGLPFTRLVARAHGGDAAMVRTEEQRTIVAMTVTRSPVRR